MIRKLPIIVLQGSPSEIGFSYGSQCRNLIHKNIELYKKLFNISEKKLFSLVNRFKNQIYKFDKKYCLEIEAIAHGAQVEAEWIYALNARTELINRLIDECTAVYFKNSVLLGQNWDWVQESEELIVLLKVSLENGLKFLTMTEAGIIGKIGLNNHGLGVCLNYLHVEKESNGIPVHILLRRILESKTIEEAISFVIPENLGTASNILLADNNGNYIDLEMAVDKMFFHRSKANIYIHTNHFLAMGFDNTAEDYAGSLSRYENASKIAKQLSGVSSDEMKLILLDATDEELPICRKYSLVEDFGNLGTVTTIIMNLRKQIMEISMGNPFDNEFEIVSLN